jgi:hypothetical protein
MSETSHRPTPFDDLEPFAVLTAQGIAARLGVDPRSVRRAIARGELPASRTCGIRVLACDAAAWWQARTVTVSAMPPRAPAATAVQSPATDLAPVRRRRMTRSSGRLPLPPRGGVA